MTADKPEKCTGVLLPAAEEAEPELPVGQEDLLPAVEGGRCDLEIRTDPGNRTAVPEVGSENLKDEAETVLTVRDDCILQESMGVAAGTFYTADGEVKDNVFPSPAVDDISAIRSMFFEHSSCPAGGAVFSG